MAELFQTTPQNITLHLKALYEESEIEEKATCKDYLQVRREGVERGTPVREALQPGRHSRGGLPRALRAGHAVQAMGYGATARVSGKGLYPGR